MVRWYVSFMFVHWERVLNLSPSERMKPSCSMLALELKVNVIPHQPQQTTNFVDGSDAAKEAHGH